MFLVFILLPLVAVARPQYQSLLANPKIRNDGFLEDTEEVAAAKEAHLKLFSKGVKHEETEETHVNYNGPLAKPTVLKSGYLADTHEVAAVKDRHLLLLKSPNLRQEYFGGKNEHQPLYHGVLFKPLLLRHSFLVDRNEAAAAKKTYEQLLQSPSQEKVTYDDKKRHQVPYHGSLFTPATLKSGYQVYTNKDNHSNLLKSSDQDQKNSHEEKHQGPYHGPLFRPVILKSGYIADTPEVAAAKLRHLRLLEGYDHFHDSSNKEVKS